MEVEDPWTGEMKTIFKTPEDISALQEGKVKPKLKFMPLESGEAPVRDKKQEKLDKKAAKQKRKQMGRTAIDQEAEKLKLEAKQTKHDLKLERMLEEAEAEEMERD